MTPNTLAARARLLIVGLALAASTLSASASDLEVAAIKATVEFLTHATMCRDLIGASVLDKPRERLTEVQILVGESESARTTELAELEGEAKQAVQGKDASTMIKGGLTRDMIYQGCVHMLDEDDRISAAAVAKFRTEKGR